MNLIRRLFIITFVESFATILVERGIYFFSHSQLGFSDNQNLWLALALSVAYVIGALASNRLSVRLTERRVLVLSILGQLVVHTGLAVRYSPALIVAGTPSSACSTGSNGRPWRATSAPG